MLSGRRSSPSTPAYYSAPSGRGADKEQALGSSAGLIATAEEADMGDGDVHQSGEVPENSASYAGDKSDVNQIKHLTSGAQWDEEHHHAMYQCPPTLDGDSHTVSFQTQRIPDSINDVQAVARHEVFNPSPQSEGDESFPTAYRTPPIQEHGYNGFGESPNAAGSYNTTSMNNHLSLGVQQDFMADYGQAQFSRHPNNDGPWNPYDVGMASGLLMQPLDEYSHTPSYLPSAGTHGESGYSSFSNRGGTRTSLTTAEGASELGVSTETLQPTLDQKISVYPYALQDEPSTACSTNFAQFLLLSFSPAPVSGNVQDMETEVNLVRTRSFRQELLVPSSSLTRHLSSSTRSDVSSNQPEVVMCEICGTKFKGKHRVGTQHRHARLIHGVDGKQKEYPCAASGCQKVYKRTDARLNHYRKEHPNLAAPAEPRKLFFSTTQYGEGDNDLDDSF